MCFYPHLSSQRFLASQNRRLKGARHNKRCAQKILEDDFAQVVETSVTNNSSFQNYLHTDDHTIRTTDTPGFKPFTITHFSVVAVIRSHLNKIVLPYYRHDPPLSCL